jgi:hypothetical protein
MMASNIVKNTQANKSCWSTTQNGSVRPVLFYNFTQKQSLENFNKNPIWTKKSNFGFLLLEFSIISVPSAFFIHPAVGPSPAKHNSAEGGRKLGPSTGFMSPLLTRQRRLY